MFHGTFASCFKCTVLFNCLVWACTCGHVRARVLQSVSIVQMMEPSLRCLVLLAQTQANMWKRNGYSLLNQVRYRHVLSCSSTFTRTCALSRRDVRPPRVVLQLYFYQSMRCRGEMYDGHVFVLQLYFYQNVRCRGEMYDRDVQMLQTGAALIDNNHFITHLLNKFGLNAWKK